VAVWGGDECNSIRSPRTYRMPEKFHASWIHTVKFNDQETDTCRFEVTAKEPYYFQSQSGQRPQCIVFTYPSNCFEAPRINWIRYTEAIRAVPGYVVRTRQQTRRSERRKRSPTTTTTTTTTTKSSFEWIDYEDIELGAESGTTVMRDNTLHHTNFKKSKWDYRYDQGVTEIIDQPVNKQPGGGYWN